MTIKTIRNLIAAMLLIGASQAESAEQYLCIADYKTGFAGGGNDGLRSGPF